MKQMFYSALWFSGILAGVLPMHAVQIIAHRGASSDAPENTLSSFKLGYQQQADADECDIHLTKDRQIVVIHDADTARTSGVTNQIGEQTLAELRVLDFGRWGPWRDRGFSERIPLLEEVLAVIPEGKRLFIEIKCGPEILPELQLVLARAQKRPQQIAIIGFNLETMRQAKTKFPQLEVCWLASADKDKKFPPLQLLIENAKAARLDGLDLNSGFPIHREFVSEVHHAGLKLYTWTVDDLKIARQEVEAGVDGITTNRPGWLRRQLGLKPVP